MTPPLKKLRKDSYEARMSRFVVMLDISQWNDHGGKAMHRESRALRKGGDVWAHFEALEVFWEGAARVSLVTGVQASHDRWGLPASWKTRKGHMCALFSYGADSSRGHAGKEEKRLAERRRHTDLRQGWDILPDEGGSEHVWSVCLSIRILVKDCLSVCTGEASLVWWKLMQRYLIHWHKGWVPKLGGRSLSSANINNKEWTNNLAS